MCLALPIRVEHLLPDDMARVTLGGVSKTVSIALVEDVQVGDYLIIHVGYALARLDPAEAEHTLALMRDAAGIGIVAPGLHLSADRARPGDQVIVSGTIGDHGVAVMSKRANLGFETEILSDSAALHDLVAEMVRVAGPSLRLMRDPTRGGLATTLNEIAQASRVGFVLDERAIPVRPEVAAACELLGLDPLNVANEGKLVAVVAPGAAAGLVAAMRAHPLGLAAAVIGHAIADDQRFVQMTTAFGGGRIVDWLTGEQLPRIC